MPTTTLRELIDDVVREAKNLGYWEADIYGRPTRQYEQELEDAKVLLREALLEVDLDLDSEIPIEWDPEKQRNRLV